MQNPVQSEEAIFYQAVEIVNVQARNRFLDEKCNDHQQRKQIDQLVDLHFGRGRILDETQANGLLAANVAELPDVGTMIGPYKLLQVIGEGGMGVVYMAEQTEPVRRIVAVKVIKLGMDTRRVVARFESERQAMALMDHPCITKVLDAGATETGRPFFVMELVKGKSITDYCDQKRLSVQQRLEAFVKICNALEHAHQKGIIHRDIKPSNIMVTNHDGIPLPKIIDFGIAKATAERLTDKTLFTNYGEMIGTPLYMSPEQAEMSEPDVDTRADIYSLGVLLYELLTGTTPYQDLNTQKFEEIRDAIRSRDPQLASTRINNLGETVKEISDARNTDERSLHRSVRGELDWILMKCLARDRNKRYQSAGELAREIQRYLKGEPIEAVAPSWKYRSQKFMRRHWASVSAAAVIALVLAAGTIFSSVMAITANKLAHRAQQAEQLATTRLGEVKKERDRAKKAEERLAKLERQQRYRATIHQAASVHNANMVKRYLVNSNIDPGKSEKLKLQMMPLPSVWNSSGKPVTLVSPTSTVTATVSNVASQQLGNSRWVFTDGNPDENIEIVIAANDVECQEKFLKSILLEQRKAFGSDNEVVAQTLFRLGDFMTERENWDESEAYFREAFEILKERFGNDPKFSEIRLKMVNAIKNRGNVEQAIQELKDCKDQLEKMNLPNHLQHVLDSVKTEIEQIGREKLQKK